MPASHAPVLVPHDLACPSSQTDGCDGCKIPMETFGLQEPKKPE